MFGAALLLVVVVFSPARIYIQPVHIHIFGGLQMIGVWFKMIVCWDRSRIHTQHGGAVFFLVYSRQERCGGAINAPLGMRSHRFVHVFCLGAQRRGNQITRIVGEDSEILYTAENKYKIQQQQQKYNAAQIEPTHLRIFLILILILYHTERGLVSVLNIYKTLHVFIYGCMHREAASYVCIEVPLRDGVISVWCLMWTRGRGFFTHEYSHDQEDDWSRDGVCSVFWDEMDWIEWEQFCLHFTPS